MGFAGDGFVEFPTGWEGVTFSKLADGGPERIIAGWVGLSLAGGILGGAGIDSSLINFASNSLAALTP
jgi:hypothetical protein